MTTFREYTTGLRPHRIKLSWGSKCVLASTIAATLFVSAMVTAIDNYWFWFLLIGLPPLILYAIYCNKKDAGVI